MKELFSKLLHKKNHIITNDIGTSFTLKKVKSIELSKNDYIEVEFKTAILHVSKNNKNLEIPLWFKLTTFKKHANPKNKEISFMVQLGNYSTNTTECERNYQDMIKLLVKKGADLSYIQKTVEELVQKVIF